MTDRMPSSILPFLRECGVPAAMLEPARLEQLAQLYRMLCAANQQTNLTRITDAGDFWLKHIADSLSLGLVCEHLFSKAWQLADVGCGAGFPLLPLAWANPRLTTVAIESKLKKADFVRGTAANLGLANVSVEARQARETALQKHLSGRFDLITVRAVGATAKLISECHGLLAPNGALVLYKTPSAVAAEMELAEAVAAEYRLKLYLSRPIALPEAAGQRQFIVAQAGRACNKVAPVPQSQA